MNAEGSRAAAEIIQLYGRLFFLGWSKTSSIACLTLAIYLNNRADRLEKEEKQS